MRGTVHACLVLAMVVSSLAFAQSTGPAAAGPTEQADAEAARVLAAEDAYVAAEVGRDEAALRRLVDESFRYNAADGTTSDKEQLIRSVLGMGMTAQEIGERSVMVEGDVAVIFGTATLHFGSGEQERISDLRYTSVYVKREGEWRMLALQMQPRSPREP